MIKIFIKQSYTQQHNILYYIRKKNNKELVNKKKI